MILQAHVDQQMISRYLKNFFFIIYMAGVRKLPCVLIDSFREGMYENMWSFMNLEMLKSMFPGIKLTTKCDIDDDKFKSADKNSICFKGDSNDGGHYVYVPKHKVKCNPHKSLGTYECGLLTRERDDGICHGAAIAYYLFHEKKFTNYKIINNPKKSDERRHNYKVILNVYIYIIESGLWDDALSKNFYADVTWIGNTTVQTKNALILLKDYITRF
jgi:hypothetical protein